MIQIQDGWFEVRSPELLLPVQVVSSEVALLIAYCCELAIIHCIAILETEEGSHALDVLELEPGDEMLWDAQSMRAKEMP